MQVLEAAVLGAVQGATEFLPVSSSGHLALAAAWMGVDPQAGGHVLAVVVHVATLLAVTWAFRRDLWGLARDLFAAGDVGGAVARREVLNLFVGTLPLLVVLVPGVRAAIIALEGDVSAVGVALCATGLLLLTTRRNAGGRRSVTPGLAALIGLAQLVAVTPGVSRSGSTIAVALLLGVAPAEAARFSFLLSVPAVAGAAVLELAHLSEGPRLAPDVLAVAFAASLLVGLAALNAMLRLVRGGRLWAFAPYLLLVGAVAIALG